MNSQQCRKHKRTDYNRHGPTKQRTDDGRSRAVDGGVVSDQKNVDTGNQETEEIQAQSGMGIAK